MALVYRYVDLLDDIIKYIGIVWGENSTLENRIRQHSKEDKFKGKNWKIEVLNVQVNSRTDAECYESHYIALYRTYNYLNVAKKKFGLCSFLPDRENEWVEYNITTKRCDLSVNVKSQKKCKKNRYDNKGRLLQKGEYQKSNGMYEFRYKDGAHSQSVYCWRLLEEDDTPVGKAQDVCLRTKIQNLQSNGYILNPEIPTLSECFKRCMRESDLQKKKKTIKNYYYLFGKHCKSIQSMKITDIIFEDVYVCLRRFAKKDKPALNTLRNVVSIINKVFQYCIENEILEKNPAINLMEELRYDGVI